MAKLSVAEAARIWIEEKRQIKQRETRLKTAETVLKDHFRKTGRHDYKGLIGFAVSTQTRLDTDKVKAELGDRLPKFQKTVEYEQLSLLR